MQAGLVRYSRHHLLFLHFVVMGLARAWRAAGPAERLVHPFGVAPPVAALQQWVSLLTHVGGKHLGWSNATNTRFETGDSPGLHCGSPNGPGLALGPIGPPCSNASERAPRTVGV